MITIHYGIIYLCFGITYLIDGSENREIIFQLSQNNNESRLTHVKLAYKKIDEKSIVRISLKLTNTESFNNKGYTLLTLSDDKDSTTKQLKLEVNDRKQLVLSWGIFSLPIVGFLEIKKLFQVEIFVDSDNFLSRVDCGPLSSQTTEKGREPWPYNYLVFSTDDAMNTFQEFTIEVIDKEEMGRCISTKSVLYKGPNITLSVSQMQLEGYSHFISQMSRTSLQRMSVTSLPCRSSNILILQKLSTKENYIGHESHITLKKHFFGNKGLVINFYIWLSRSHQSHTGVGNIMSLHSTTKDASIDILLLKGSILKFNIAQGSNLHSYSSPKLIGSFGRWNKLTFQITEVEVSIQINCQKILSFFNDIFTKWENLTGVTVLEGGSSETSENVKLSAIELFPLTNNNNIKMRSCSLIECFHNRTEDKLEESSLFITTKDLIFEDVSKQFSVERIRCFDRWLETIAINVEYHHEYEPLNIDLADGRFEGGFLVEFYIRSFMDSSALIMALESDSTQIKMYLSHHISCSIRNKYTNASVFFRDITVDRRRWNKVTLSITPITTEISVNCAESEKHKNSESFKWRQLKRLYLLGKRKEPALYMGEIADLNILSKISNQPCIFERCMDKNQRILAPSQNLFSEDDDLDNIFADSNSDAPISSTSEKLTTLSTPSTIPSTSTSTTLSTSTVSSTLSTSSPSSTLSPSQTFSTSATSRSSSTEGTSIIYPIFTMSHPSLTIPIAPFSKTFTPKEVTGSKKGISTSKMSYVHNVVESDAPPKYNHFIESLLMGGQNKDYYDYHFYRCNFLNIPIISRRVDEDSVMKPLIIKNTKQLFSSEGFIIEFYIWLSQPVAEYGDVEPILNMHSPNEYSKINISLLRASHMKIELIQFGEEVSLPHKSLKLQRDRWNKISIQITLVDISIQMNCEIIQTIFNEGFTAWWSLSLINVLFDQRITTELRSNITRLQLIPLDSSSNINMKLCSFNVCLKTSSNTKDSAKELTDGVTMDDFLNQFRITYLECEGKFVEIITGKNTYSDHLYQSLNVNLRDAMFDEGFQIEFYLRPDVKSKGRIFALEDTKTKFTMEFSKYAMISIKTADENIQIVLEDKIIKTSKWTKITVQIDRVKIRILFDCDIIKDIDNSYLPDWKKFLKLFLFKNNDNEDFLQADISSLRILPYSFNVSNCQMDSCLKNTSFRSNDVSSKDFFRSSDIMKSSFVTSKSTRPSTKYIQKEVPGTTIIAASTVVFQNVTGNCISEKCFIAKVEEDSSFETPLRDFTSISSLLVDSPIHKYYNYKFFRCKFENIPIISRNGKIDPEFITSTTIKDKKMSFADGFLIQFYIWISEWKSEYNGAEPILYLHSLNHDCNFKVVLLNSSLLQISIFQFEAVPLPHGPLKLPFNRWNKVTIQVTTVEISIQLNCGTVLSIFNEGLTELPSLSKLNVLYDERMNNEPQSKLTRLHLIPLKTSNNIKMMSCSFDNCLLDSSLSKVPDKEHSGDLITSDFLKQFKTTYFKCFDTFLEVLSKKDSDMDERYTSLAVNLTGGQYDSGFQIEFYLLPLKRSRGHILIIKDEDLTIGLKVDRNLLFSIESDDDHHKFEYRNIGIKYSKWNKMAVQINSEKIKISVNCDIKLEIDNMYIPNWTKTKNIFVLRDTNDQEFLDAEISDVRVLPYVFSSQRCLMNECLIKEKYSSLISEDGYSENVVPIPDPMMTFPQTPKPSFEEKSPTPKDTLPKVTSTFGAVTPRNLRTIYPTIDFLLSDLQRSYLTLDLYNCPSKPIIVISRHQKSELKGSEAIFLENSKISSVDGFKIEFYISLSTKEGFSKGPRTILKLLSNETEDLTLTLQMDRKLQIKLTLNHKSHVVVYEFNALTLQMFVWNKVEVQISHAEVVLTVNCNSTQVLPQNDITNWQQLSLMQLLIDNQSEFFLGNLALLSLLPLEEDNNILHRRQGCVVHHCLRSNYDGVLSPINLQSGIVSNYSSIVHKPALTTAFFHCFDTNIAVFSIASDQNHESINPFEVKNNFEKGIHISVHLWMFKLEDVNEIPVFSILTQTEDDQVVVVLENRTSVAILTKTKQGSTKITYNYQSIEMEKWNKIDIFVATAEVGLDVNCRGIASSSKGGFINWRGLKKMLLLTNSMNYKTSKQAKLANIRMMPWNNEVYQCYSDPCFLAPQLTTLSKVEEATVKLTKTSTTNTPTAGYSRRSERGPRGVQGPHGEKGDQGFKGTSGNKGDKGDMGPRGFDGKFGIDGGFVKGFKGIIGSQGTPGIKGEKGSNGQKGSNGYMGNSGRPGKVGAKGLNGDVGDKGFKGGHGLRGQTGNEGIRGNIGKSGKNGTKGESGSKGTKGDFGKIGSNGVRGISGRKGLRGKKGAKGTFGQRGMNSSITGSKGSTGLPGKPGENGLVGSKGVLGKPGQLGNRGDNGAEGKMGHPGLPGRTGVIGLQGRKGIHGKEGAIGSKGSAGIEGPKGKRGDTGDIGTIGIPGLLGPGGDTGPIGKEGEQGPPGPNGEKGQQGISLPGIKGMIGEMGAAGPRGEKGSAGKKGEIGVKGLSGLPGDKGEQGSIGLSKQGINGNIGEKGNSGSPGQEGPIGSVGEPGQVGLAGSVGVAGKKGEYGDIGDIGEIGERGPNGAPGTYLFTDVSVVDIQNISNSLVKLINETNNSLNYTNIKLDTSSRLMHLYEQVFSHRNERGFSQEWPSVSCKDILLQNPNSMSLGIWLDPNEGSPDDSFRADCKKRRPLLPKEESQSSFTCISSSYESGDLLTYLKPYDPDVTWQSELRLEGLVLAPPDLRKGYPHLSQLNFIQMRSKYAEQEIEFLCDESIVYADLSNQEENLNSATAFLTLDDNFLDLSKGKSLGPGYGYMDKRIYLFDNGRSIFNVTILYDECKYKAPGTFTKMLLSTNKPEMLPIVDFRIKFFKDNGKCVLGANIYPVCFE